MRMLLHLKNSPGQGLFFARNFELHVLLGFANDGWVCCIDTHKSISGFCFFVGITWKSKQQTIVSCSSAKTEYHALVVYLFHDLPKLFLTYVLYCDCQSDD